MRKLTKDTEMKKGLIVIFGLFIAGVVVLGNVSNSPTTTNETETTSTSTEVEDDLSKDTQNNVASDPFDFESKTGGKIGGSYMLNALRFGGHEGFERIVVELSQNSGTPKYSAALVSNSIRIELSDVTDQEYTGQRSFKTGGSVATSVKVEYPEDDSKIVIVIGLAEENGFRVSSLNNLSRLVIDVEK